MRRLVRFRVDPSKARVSIKRDGDYGNWWIVTIRPKAGEFPVVTACRQGPKRALAVALRKAEAANIPGVDIDMGSSYEHPWGGK